MTNYFTQKDKQGHFVAGLMVAFLVALLSWNGFYGFIAACVAGAIKEGMDYFDPEHHVVEFADFVATALGGVPFLIIFLTLQ